MLSRDQVLDDITLYWLTGTGASSARLYGESIEQVSRWFTDPVEDIVTVPTGCTVFPREVPRPSRRLAEQRFTNIVHWGEPEQGGHFGAWSIRQIRSRGPRRRNRHAIRLEGQEQVGRLSGNVDSVDGGLATARRGATGRCVSARACSCTAPPDRRTAHE